MIAKWNFHFPDSLPLTRQGACASWFLKDYELARNGHSCLIRNIGPSNSVVSIQTGSSSLGSLSNLLLLDAIKLKPETESRTFCIEKRCSATEPRLFHSI